MHCQDNVSIRSILILLKQPRETWFGDNDKKRRVDCVENIHTDDDGNENDCEDGDANVESDGGDYYSLQDGDDSNCNPGDNIVDESSW